MFRTLTKIVIDKFNQFVCVDFFTVSYTDMKEALQEFAIWLNIVCFIAYILDVGSQGPEA